MFDIHTWETTLSNVKIFVSLSVISIGTVVDSIRGVIFRACFTISSSTGGLRGIVVSWIIGNSVSWPLKTQLHVSSTVRTLNVFDKTVSRSFLSYKGIQLGNYKTHTTNSTEMTYRWQGWITYMNILDWMTFTFLLIMC